MKRLSDAPVRKPRLSRSMLEALRYFHAAKPRYRDLWRRPRGTVRALEARRLLAVSPKTLCAHLTRAGRAALAKAEGAEA